MPTFKYNLPVLLNYDVVYFKSSIPLAATLVFIRVKIRNSRRVERTNDYQSSDRGRGSIFSKIEIGLIAVRHFSTAWG